MTPLPCPFCGAPAVARFDGPEVKPFYVRCSNATCPGWNTSQSYADAEIAMQRWNHRAQLPPPVIAPVCDVMGFARKNMIRGELITLTLDRTGVFVSDQVEFSPHSKPLCLRASDR